jgi:ubiquinone/menaquinone biosynthesis C-methylase UbiE
MKNTEVFTGKSNLYSKYRANYSKTLITHLYSNVGLNSNSHIADIGSGTGMFTKLLLDQVSKVYSVEPNASMRMVAENELSHYKNFISVNATGENTLLPRHSIDYITVAQAFHWLDTDFFIVECNRILKTNGKVIVIYNRKKKEAEINKKLAELIKKYYPDHKDVINHWELRENKIMKFFNNKFEFVTYKNDITNNLQEFIGRTMSHSFSENNEDYIAELKEFFEKYSKNDIIYVPNDTIAYIGTIQ